MNAELEIQKALYNLFTEGSPAVGYDTYDDTPQGANYPYVVIGEATSEAFDSKTFNGFETAVIIHTWSRFNGREQIKEMMGSVYDLLHDTYLPVTGYNTALCLFEFSETFLENDGITRHGIQRFNLINTKE
jgi:hypothetical protein